MNESNIAVGLLQVVSLFFPVVAVIGFYLVDMAYDEYNGSDTLTEEKDSKRSLLYLIAGTFGIFIILGLSAISLIVNLISHIGFFLTLGILLLGAGFLVFVGLMSYVFYTKIPIDELFG